ncbi:MAG: cadherin-like beta sandwich domain-containing protein, partial [candidate division Zixibacteria bacterium]|nr:cadherin-like beta sandwich domain-containing protein [candidate division Zixibacteria bacterium]
YAVVVLNDTSLTVSATSADSNATISINGGASGTGSRTQDVTLTAGAVTTINVVVTGASPDTCATQTYTIQARLLNYYEVNYGYYSGVMVANKIFTWRKPTCDAASGTNGVPTDTNNVNSHVGQQSGNMNWQLYRNGTSGGYSRMRFSNYYNNQNDSTNENLLLPTSNTPGSGGTCETDAYGQGYITDDESWPYLGGYTPTAAPPIGTWYTTPYVESANSSGTITPGFQLNGSSTYGTSTGFKWEAHTNTDGNGAQISNSATDNSTDPIPFYVFSPQGDLLVAIENHYRVLLKDAVVSAQADSAYSFSVVTYLGVSKKLKYLAQTASVRSLGQEWDGSPVYWDPDGTAWDATAVGVPSWWTYEDSAFGTPAALWDAPGTLWPF